jgi:hypothetical protein
MVDVVMVICDDLRGGSLSSSHVPPAVQSPIREPANPDDVRHSRVETDESSSYGCPVVNALE